MQGSSTEITKSGVKSHQSRKSLSINSNFFDNEKQFSKRSPGTDQRKKYQIKSKIFQEDKNKMELSKENSTETSEFVRSPKKGDLGSMHEIKKKTQSHRDLLATLGKGPIFEKLRSKMKESIDESKYEGNDNSELNPLEKKLSSIMSVQPGEDRKSKDSLFTPKNTSAKPSEKDIRKLKSSVELKEKSYLEDKTDAYQFLNMSVSGIQKQSSFKIELNKMNDSKKEEDLLKIMEKLKAGMIESIMDPSSEHKPIVYSKKLGLLSGFSAFTYQNFKKVNEDKINITLNNKTKKEHLTTVQYFGVFDGHGGSKCAEFLRDNLHKIILEDPEFLDFPDKAIQEGFKKAEDIIIQKNLDLYENSKEFDRSGSCAVTCFIFKNKIYIANLGDSRAIACKNNFSQLFQLTHDHKPNEDGERKRIFKSGGSLYRNEFEPPNASPAQGVFRTNPGGLAVSRTLGDVEAKLEELGGKPNVIIGIPDVIGLNIDFNIDFLILGSDGIYDKLSNKEIVSNVIETSIDSINSNLDFDAFMKKAVQNILKLSIEKDSKDNISCVILFFENFANYYRIRDADFFRNKLSSFQSSEAKDDEMLQDGVICRKEMGSEVLINNYFPISNNVNAENINNKIEVKRSFKLFCCSWFCKKKPNKNENYK